jgi:hypothetical protein
LSKRICSAIAIALLVAVAAGCGSSSNDKAPTKAEFLKKGNAICKAGDTKTNAAAKKQFNGGKPNQAETLAFVKSTVLPDVSKQVDGIDALTPPKGDEKQVQAIVDSARAALNKAKADPKLLTSNTAFAKTNKLTKAYGLTVCGGS